MSITGNCLLFCLVFGMSATVDMRQMERQLRNKPAILTAIGMQFVVIPFIGFLVVHLFQLDFPVGVTLLIITTSPGGSYSNWWCSLFNADLALSVSTTAISTIVSLVMLPLNLFLYSILAFDDNVADDISFVTLFESIGVVIIAIGLGTYMSMKENSHRFNMYANKLGNISGLALITFSSILSNMGNDNSKIWQRPVSFYAAVAIPCTCGLIIANFVAYRFIEVKPECVTASIEACYQNVGIATSVALSMFQDDDLAEAMGVPLFYGLVEAILLGIYCTLTWKLDWTKAPSHDPFLRVITMSYEIISAEEYEKEILDGEWGGMDGISTSNTDAIVMTGDVGANPSKCEYITYSDADNNEGKLSNPMEKESSQKKCQRLRSIGKKIKKTYEYAKRNNTKSVAKEPSGMMLL